jgi:hypothetical protein
MNNYNSHNLCLRGNLIGVIVGFVSSLSLTHFLTYEVIQMKVKEHNKTISLRIDEKLLRQAREFIQGESLSLWIRELITRELSTTVTE